MKLSARTLFIFPVLLMSYEMVSYLSNDAYLPALPQIMYDLATTHRFTQLTLTSFYIGGALTQLFIGPVSERFG